MKPNKLNEKFFLKLVKDGILEVSKTGIVYNYMTGRNIGYKSARGYMSLGYKDRGQPRHILIHRLVWLVYKGKIPKGIEINHKNGIKSDNKLSNLELVTGSENMQHAHDLGLVSKEDSKIKSEKLQGEKGVLAKISNNQAKEIRQLYANGGYTYRSLAKIYGVDHTAIGYIIRRQTFKNI